MTLRFETEEFTHSVNVRTLPRKGRLEKRTLEHGLREAIATAYDLIEVIEFEAEALLAPWKKDGVSCAGCVRASLIQPCSISGEPLEATLKEDFELVLVPEGSRLAKPQVNGDGELVFDPEGEDLPDTFSGDSIDLADIWIEFFALGLDPYLRAPGVNLEDVLLENGLKQDAASPFAALSKLKKDLN